jgi:Tol biopolymer transport system component
MRVFAAAAGTAAAALVLAASASPSYPGLVGSIAFDRPGDANVDIYSINADGSNLRNLSSSAGGDHDPRYSRDGSRIVFVSTRDGNFEIYAMNADGSGVTRVTNNPAKDELPAWTADDRIVFVSDRDVNEELYVMNADGSNIQRLTNDLAFDYFPAPAPTGDRVAFISDRDGTFDIYTLSLSGGAAARVTDAPVADTWPIWSPDGNRIAFTRWNGANHVLFTVNVDGSNIRQVTNAPGREEAAPAWSPDGTQIAFLGCLANNCDLIVRRADGTGGETTLVKGGAGAPDWQARPHSTATAGSGGDSIASAPELSLGQRHVASRSGGPDYWRVTLGNGDQFTMHVAAAGTSSLHLCLLPPGISDTNSDNAICAVSAIISSASERELGLVAPAAGRWTLVFDGCGSCDRIFHPHDGSDVSYVVTALVRRATQITMHAPRRVHAGTWFTCRGRVAGATSGKVELKARQLGRWQPLATPRLQANGFFAARARLPKPSQRTTLRVQYAGDAGHLPSSTTLAISVT